MGTRMGDSQKILIVDDKDANLVALETVLRDTGAEVIRASSGDEALAASLHHSFALAVLDVQMPEMDGYELAGFLRGEPTTRNLPIIFLTAASTDEIQEFKGYEAGGVDFITKPYSPTVLLAKTKVFLDLDREWAKLRRRRDQLEDLVRQRTEELQAKNQAFVAEIAERTRAEAALQAEQQKLHAAYAQLRDTQFMLMQSAKLTALGEMAAGVAHELNQPLNGIKLIVQEALLDRRRDRYDPSRFTSDGKEIVSLVTKMAGIIDHMRSFARKPDDLPKERIDINSCVHGALTFMRQQLLVHDIELECELSADLPTVFADPNSLEQVFMNLVANARDAIFARMAADKRRAGKIAIRSFRLNDAELCIDVEDDGGGVPVEIREKVFEPFFTTKEVGKGTGLGLSIAERIVNECGGRLELSAEKETGALFHVILPIA